jgi:hypothetical protein
MKKSSLNSLFAVDINRGTKYDFIDLYLSMTDFLSCTLVEDVDSLRAIHKYKLNRAEVPLNNAHIQKIAENLHIPSLGLVPISKDPETNKWHMFDFHNRTKSAHKRKNNGEMQEQEFNSLILVRIVPWKYALDVYVHVNNTEKHSNMNKLLNPQLPAGKFVVSITDKAEMSDVQSGWKRQVFNQAFVSTLETPNIPYHIISQSRAAEASKLLNTTPTKKGPVIDGWKDTHEFYLVNALKKTVNIYANISKTPSNQMSKELKTLTKSATMFGLLLNYSISKDSKINYILKDLETVASNIIANATALEELVTKFTKESKIKDAEVFKILSKGVENKSKKEKKFSAGFKMKMQDQILTANKK